MQKLANQFTSAELQHQQILLFLKLSIFGLISLGCSSESEDDNSEDGEDKKGIARRPKNESVEEKRVCITKFL